MIILMHELSQVLENGANGGELSSAVSRERVPGPDECGEISSAKRRTSDAALNALEFFSGKNIGFSQAAERLKKVGYDLEKVRSEEMRVHREWGLTGTLIERGAVKSEEDYARLWEGCRFSGLDLRALEEGIQRGDEIMPVFNPGSLSREELVDVLVRKTGIPCGTECYGAQNYDKLRKISERNLPREGELSRMDWMQRMRAFRNAYELAADPEPENPSISFTPDSLTASAGEKSPIALIGEIRIGKRFMDPLADILRWRRQFDRCTNGDYPDRAVQTVYPQYVFDIGRIATMSCYEHNPIFFLGDCLPDDSWKSLGARPVIASAE